jgi:hypothetical protein
MDSNGNCQSLKKKTRIATLLAPVVEISFFFAGTYSAARQLRLPILDSANAQGLAGAIPYQTAMAMNT